MSQSAAKAVYFGRNTPDSGFPGQPPFQSSSVAADPFPQSASGNETMQMGEFSVDVSPRVSASGYVHKRTLTAVKRPDSNQISILGGG